MALQREAIAKGFKNSIGEIKGTDSSLSGKDILDFLLNSSRIWYSGLRRSSGAYEKMTAVTKSTNIKRR